MATTVLLRSVGAGYTTQVTTRHHAFIADEPQPEGDNLGPSPYDLLLGALGACTSMTLLMYARRKNWPLEHVQVELTHDREHVTDCEDCEEDSGTLLDVVHRQIRLEGDLTPEQRERLKEIARRCPVHRTLTASMKIVDELE